MFGSRQVTCVLLWRESAKKGWVCVGWEAVLAFVLGNLNLNSNQCLRQLHYLFLNLHLLQKVLYCESTEEAQNNVDLTPSG